MNRDEIKQILLLYRPGTADAEDPEIAQALALAQADPELSRWFAEHCARQIALREKFQQIPVLAGLKEQIVSEQAAKSKAISRRDKIVSSVAVVAILASLMIVAFLYWPHKPVQSPPANMLADYQNDMVNNALSSYYMNLPTNDPVQIQAYLATNQAPADYVLPAGLQKIAMTGCSIDSWNGIKATMICFRRGPTLPPHKQGDLWLFVIDRSAVKDASTVTATQFAQVNGLITATWTQGNDLYVLGTAGDESTIKKYL